MNGSDTPITIDDILLDEIEEGLEGDPNSCEGCSSLVADAPPNQDNPNLFPIGKWFGFIIYLDEIA